MKKLSNRFLLLIITAVAAFSLAGCSSNQDNANTTATTTVTPPPTQVLKVVSTPQAVLDQKNTRGEQEEAKPELHVISPVEGAVVDGPVVAVKLHLAGDLKGYQPHKDPTTEKGNHIHVILDNEPYEAYYELDQPFELRNVIAGEHTLRVFASRPWHESYKNPGSFQMVTFTVKVGGDRAKPTTTSSGQTMANNAQPASSASPRERKDMAASKGSEVDPTKPLLTYSRPKGEYKGAEADPIMIDFWISNARLKGDGGEYRVRYIIDDDEPGYLDKWEPIWLSGWLGGNHTVRLELIGPEGWPVRNAYNTTTRELIVTH